MRLHLFEFEDLDWFPDVIRTGGTDYLRYFLKYTSLYEPVAPLIYDMLQQTGQQAVVDLCSGAGGSIEETFKAVNKLSKQKIQFLLTDKFPNSEAYAHISRNTANSIYGMEEPVDAMDVPACVGGVRVMFSAVHHFRPDGVKAVLKNAVDSNKAIALFDGGDKNIFSILGILLLHPIVFLLLTPFFKPFKLSRLLFTYIVPLIPLYTIWDGCVSILRLYKPQELMSIANDIGADHYAWQCGKLKNKWGLHVTYLTGIPKINP